MYFQLISQIGQKVHFVKNFLIKKLQQKNIYNYHTVCLENPWKPWKLLGG